MIFVTGGTGFLGRHLIAELCRAKESIRVLTRFPHKHTWLKAYPNVEVVGGDLRDINTLRHAIKGCDRIIHAAGLFSMWGGAGDFIGTNTQGTANLLQVAHEQAIRRVVYVSTVAVIGEPTPNLIIDEQHPPRPSDIYQQSKLEAERAIQAYHTRYGMDTVILRPGAFYGPLGDYAFNRLFFTDPLRGLIMQMDGGHYIIFPVYIGDVVQGILKGLAHGRAGETYNICGDCLSHREAFDVICKEGVLWYPRLNIPRFVGLNFARLLTAIANITHQEPFYPIGLKSYVFNDWRVSSEKARRELGFIPTPFVEGVRRTLAWYKEGRPHTLKELNCGTE